MNPDFICIGAQKAGTTWLYRQLRAHPDAWLPPVKELHYFDREARRCAHHPLARLGEPGTRAAFAEWLGELRHHRQPGDLAWGRHYFFGERNDQWYVRLFEPGRERLAGEFTPAYSAMSPGRISHVARLAPQARILLILRNPVERAWSHAVMNLCRFAGRAVSDVSDEAFLAHFSGRGSRRRGDYPGMLRRWQSAFPADQLHVRFYDELKASPGDFLAGVCQFLGLDPSPLPRTLSPTGVTINSGGYDRIPARLEKALSAQYLDMLTFLADQFGTPADRWLSRAQSLLQAR
ncbi:sulfotransferase [Marinihelvus fidelis]|uniref:Sulfotransferase n=1 Tax=Marinihelvus fidelis TaxID=2613842 RepID=A0A5N0TDZ4_9GAMM|nr:sulfotransferase [Marinihelvus fidelis]KAA9131519.1 sulfotransferase [Marinihelvus fidelis]